MSGTKKIYNLTEKNYFKFFGIDEKYGISVRSLTTHYKKVVAILKEDTTVLGNDKLMFAERAFNTLADPISRARYLIELNGEDTDIIDNLSVIDRSLSQHYEYALADITSVAEIDDFIADLKDQSQFIIDQIESSIDTYKNYKNAMGLICKFHSIAEIHNAAKDKKQKLNDGIKYVVFDR
jgi:hypothetical protein